ncbi:MAG: FecR domain-containing protein [Candidatus Tantalella remota]|nr:FecR domain-containing protein [Candidatus Tantalella remota]
MFTYILTKRYITFVMLAVFIVFYCHFSTAQETVDEASVEIISLSGDVNILSPVTNTWTGAITGLRLISGNRIRTSDNSHVNLAFNPQKNNIVSVRANSHVVLQLKGADKLTLIDGTLFSSIQELVDGSSFEIKTPLATCGVCGTKYTLSYYANTKLTTLAVMESSVVLESITEPDKFVSVKELEERELAPWDNIYLDATGVGFSTDMPAEGKIEEISEKDYMGIYTPDGLIHARRTAETDAYRNLAARIYGTVIDSKTVLGDYAKKNNEVKVTVSGLVRGAQEMGIAYFSDGSVRITMEIRGLQLKDSLSPLTGDIFDKTCITGADRLTQKDLKYFDEALL